MFNIFFEAIPGCDFTGGPQFQIARFVSWWTFRILFFFLLGEGEWGVRGARGGGGVGFLIESRRGGFSRTGGADGPEGCLQPVGGFGGGEAKYFFSGPNVHQGRCNSKSLRLRFCNLGI